jgi:hypothetical protein
MSIEIEKNNQMNMAAEPVTSNDTFPRIPQKIRPKIRRTNAKYRSTLMITESTRVHAASNEEYLEHRVSFPLNCFFHKCAWNEKQMKAERRPPRSGVVGSQGRVGRLMVHAAPPPPGAFAGAAGCCRPLGARHSLRHHDLLRCRATCLSARRDAVHCSLPPPEGPAAPPGGPSRRLGPRHRRHNAARMSAGPGALRRRRSSLASSSA